MVHFKKPMLAVLGIITSFTAQAESVDFTLCGGERSMYGTSLKETYDVAIRVDCPSLRGAKVTGIAVEVPADAVMSAPQGWLSSDLVLKGSGSRKEIDPDIALSEGAISGGTLSVTFKEPYVVTGQPFYAGYSFTVSGNGESDKKPVSVSSGGAFHELWIHTSRKYPSSWKDVGGETGLCSTLRLMLDVDRHPQALALALPDILYVSEGNDEIECTVSNFGTEPVKRFSYTYTAGQVHGSGTAEADVPAGAYPERAAVKLRLGTLPSPGRYPIEISITDVDGLPNLDPAPGTGTVLSVLSFVPKVRPLVEEYTGLWCGYCPSGYVTLEEMREAHPDDFVALAYHVDDAMSCIPSSQFQSSPGGLPKAFVNRGDGINPLDIPAQWNMARDLHLPAELSVSLDWVDQGRAAVRATSLLRFAEALENADYRVAYVLIGDGLKDDAWRQSNYYSGKTSEYSGKWWDIFTHGESAVMGLEYNDVVLSSPMPEGMPQSVPSQTEIDQEVTGTFVFRIDDLTNLKGNALPVIPEKLRCVAILLDGKTGKPLTSASSGYPGQDSPMSVTSVTEAGISRTEWHDLLGRRIDAPHGICIRTDFYDDGTIRSSKLLTN